jgi:hypothetical protein
VIACHPDTCGWGGHRNPGNRCDTATVIQRIPFTDYPVTAPKKFYVSSGVLMLPEEY